MSKWLTMRELIRAEERLMFARHNQTPSIRNKCPERPDREAERERVSPRMRAVGFRKELY